MEYRVKWVTLKQLVHYIFSSAIYSNGPSLESVQF